MPVQKRVIEQLFAGHYPVCKNCQKNSLKSECVLV